ncbi:CaiB/BaiF CoA transferase family protein [Streptomyces sp. NPDC002577]
MLEAETTMLPLDGLRVVDFTTVMAGPYCTRVLSSLGADVIKIESRDGDYTRGAAPLRDNSSAYFAELNNGKRGVVLDLKHELGRAAAQEMIAQADVVVENMRAGVMARLGLDYPSMSRRKPDLVYCSITGFGQDSPYATRPATAQVVHATVGYDRAFAAYQRDDTELPATGLFAADGMAGALAVSGILAALRVRDLTGQGRHVDVALDQALLSMMVYEVQTARFPMDYTRKGYRPARTKDGAVMIAAVNKRNFEALSRVLERPDLLTDPRFATTAPRWRSYGELHAIIEEWTGTRTSEECERALVDAGVPATRYRTVEEYLAEPQARERMMTPAQDGAGRLDVTGLPFRLTPSRPTAPGAGAAAVRHVPELGGDTRAVLSEWLGRERADAVLDAGAAYDAGDGGDFF